MPASTAPRASLVRRAAARVLREVDRAFGHNRLLERALVGMLGKYYASRFRADWMWPRAEDVPHFFDHRLGMFAFVFGDADMGPYPYYRGFFGSEVIRTGDVLLDIGCGDGFFTKRFFSSRCSHVDAIDVEPGAIRAASRANAAPNIAYHRLDATRDPWPRERYDVVVWDGALGHFSSADTAGMLRRIAGAIGDHGVFVGSESLGPEGTDHLQFFEDPDAVRRLLSPLFACVELREERFPLRRAEEIRREVFWRCSQDPARIASCRWIASGSIPEEARSREPAPRPTRLP
jgi:2-polyprenyl-3-methyl-5-hydroxy-6-metoxy-1,4-benzoquinol methylase